MTHDQLADDLAEYLESRVPPRVVWTNIPLGPSGSPRPDVYAMRRSFTQPLFTAYEVKATRQDFRADVTAGKWQAYLTAAEAVYFAVPSGLVRRDEVPTHAGLIVRHDAGWRVQKRATVNVVTLPESVLIKLLIDGIDRAAGCRVRDEWELKQGIRKQLGDRVADILLDQGRAEQRVAASKEAAKKTLDSVAEDVDRRREDGLRTLNQRRTELKGLVGLPQDANNRDIRKRMDEIRERIDKNGEVKHLKAAIEKVRCALTETEWPIAKAENGKETE